MAAAPFKVAIPCRGACIGIAAHSYDHLREVLRTRYKIRGDFCLQQDDGTLVCDEDYFQLLEPHTKLTVVDSERTLSEDACRYSESTGIGIGEKGFSVVEADSSSILPAAKRPRLENLLYPGAASPKDPLYMHNVVGTLHHLPQQMSRMSPQPPRVITPPQGRPGSLPSWSQVHTSPPRVPPSLLPPCGSSTASAISPSQLASNTTSPSSLVSRLQIANVMSLSQPTQGHTPPGSASQPLIPPLTQPQPYIPSPHQIHPGLPTLSSMNPGSAATRFIPATPSRPVYLPSQQQPHQQVPTMLLPPREQQGYLVPLQLVSRQLPQHPSTNPWPTTSASTAQKYTGIRGPYAVSPISQVPPTLRQMYAIPTSVQPALISSGCNPQGVFPSGGQRLQQKSSTLTKDMYAQPQQIVLPSTSRTQQSATHPHVQPVQRTTPTSVVSACSVSTEPSPPKKVLEVKVVQCSDAVVEERGEEEEEEEEEGDRLCIVEHACPRSPDPEKVIELEPSPAEPHTHPEPILHKKKTKPPNLQLCPSKPTPEIELHPITEEELERVIGQPSPDEGYSSSPSPYDFTKDFTSQLPFATFEGYQTSQTAEQLQLGDKRPESKGDREEEGEEIVDVVTVDEGEVNSDANTGDAVVVSLLTTKNKENKEEEEESDVDLGEFSSHVQALLEDEPLWEKREILEPGSIADVSSDDEVFSSATMDMSDLGTELIVSVPIINLPNRVQRRRASSLSSQSSKMSSMSLHTRQRHRRKRRRGSRLSVPEELLVKIPLHHINDATYLGLVSGSQSEGTEDSDAPSTIELVAASMQSTPKPKRVPQIIRLEPHFDLASPPPRPLPRPRLAVEPEVEVQEYGRELILPTGSVLCSQHDLDSCVNELLNVMQQMRHSNGVGGSEDLCLDIGDEVELGEVELGEASEDSLTGMDLLNLSDHEEVPEMETDESNSHCKDALEDEPYSWTVQTLVKNSTCYVSDPRQEIQRYSFGPNTCFQLCRSNGEWELQSI